MAKKRTSKLEGNVVAAMQRLNELESEIHGYFYWDSRFAKAMAKHIQEFKNLMIELPYSDCHLYYPRGQGPFSVKKTCAYGQQIQGNDLVHANVFRFEFEVLFTSQEREDETGNQEYFAKKYTVNVPVELEDETLSDTQFEKRFNAWLKVKREEMLAERKTEDMKVLKTLLKKYPDDAREILE